MTVGYGLQLAIKVLVSLLVIALMVAFLYALWRRDVDLGQYRTTRWWFGKWFDVWFPENPNLLKNGDFERGLYGWGSGWIESMPRARDFAREHRYVNLLGAESRWMHDPRGGRNGSGALRVEHASERMAHRFSTFSQQIEVKPFTTYEVRFWAKVEQIDPGGGLNARAGISDEKDWELGKRKVEPRAHDWKEYTFRFTSKEQAFVDIRFAAEAPVKAWLDDVSVREVQ